MSGSEDPFGDSDDDALLYAATQIEQRQAPDEFEDSPRPSKRRRVEREIANTDDEAELSDTFGSSDTLDGSENDFDPAKNRTENVEPQGMFPPQKPRHLFHAPRINPTFNNVIVIQTQNVAHSQPWMIRGPIWKKPKIIESNQDEVTKNPVRGSEDVVRRPMSDDEDEVEDIVEQRSVRKGGAIARQENTAHYDPTQDLANLPSDAFSSSNPADDVVFMESRPSTTNIQARRMGAPTTGLIQTTLFERKGVTLPPSQANKKRNWPLMNQEEPPTHHKLIPEAMETWVYPTNLGKIRDYQFNIVHRGLFHNLLVALPTGLGKTFIAATIMLNFYRWTQDAQIIFVAPTKPLVAQQVEACFTIAGIPRSQTTMLTGEVSAGLRADEWSKKRVFFMTPQTLINDLKTGICDPKRVVLVVIDEAHRATGGYAYVEVVKFIRRFNESFRVLALTATPGGTVDAVQRVVDGLDISRCEIRTEQSLDIRDYVHSKDVMKQAFDPSEEMELLFDWFSQAIGPVLSVVNGVNAYWVKDPLKLTAYGCNQALREWGQSAGRHASQQVKGMVFSVMSVLGSIAHSLELLKYYSIRCFYDKLLTFRKETREGKSKSKYRLQIDQNQHFEKMMVRLKAWTCDPEFTGHPKLEQVRAEVLNHFIEAGEGENGGQRTATRVEIFSHYRDSVEEIVKVLSRDSPIVRPHVFVGQAAGKNSEGMTQKKQLEVTQKFKNGDYNVLISTSVGEEGLDIGEVDLIICYDSKSSPIRLLQRMGRTGRKRSGKVIWLQMKGKEQEDAIKAMDNYEKMQGLIADGDQFNFHHDRSRRIVPKEIVPVVDKRTVDIPIENTQRTPSDFLPVPTKKGRGKLPKRPAKKFHMPDGVRTGFTTASRFDADSDDEGAAPRAKTKRKTGPPPEEAEPVPSMEEVRLTEAQTRELFQHYQDTMIESEEQFITMPKFNRFPTLQRQLRRTARVPHGWASKLFVETMNRLSTVDEYSVQEHETNVARGLLEIEDVAHTLAATSPTEDEEQPRPRPRGRPPGKKATITHPESANIPFRKKGRTLVRTGSAAEGDASSPPLSSPRMAIRSQGVWLGSNDTPPGSDRDHDGYEDGGSDLADFIDDGEPVVEDEDEDLDLSLPSPSTLLKKRPAKARPPSQLSIMESSQDLPDVGTLIGDIKRQKSSTPIAEPVKEKSKRRRRNVVQDDDDDE
ncbi:P-loop containing nucleoside triphosphate hydrolase protein [Tothia fuscella]|uniref:ATP-dependent DNA helicase n=1 Tax=Tothia fuscella TaxID=1048955 RepID=A0A9P4P079_9PEZI|nr:P-loop containing nucleoside triphosphate hydrolase protein [Tothia fuscella]